MKPTLNSDNTEGYSMFKVLHANTSEIDDPACAVKEILEQLDCNRLEKHSIGILGCHLDYTLNGTIEMLCRKLPFDVIGTTTITTDICGDAGEDQLALIVVTGDDVYFSSSISKPLTDDADKLIADAYLEAADKLVVEPRLALFIGPSILALAADSQVEALDKASDSIPLFGTIALDYTDSIRSPRTIYNGGDFADRLPLILIGGAIKPHFYCASVPKDSYLNQEAIITLSDGNVLKEVNNMPAITYIEALGLAENGVIASVPSIPLSIDEGDGSKPSARAILTTTPEGWVVCSGTMPESATLGIGSLTIKDITSTAAEVAHAIQREPDAQGALIFSCLSRNIALGLDIWAESEIIKSIVSDDLAYLFLYSAGEIYPDITENRVYNKAHNYSIIACIL